MPTLVSVLVVLVILIIAIWIISIIPLPPSAQILRTVLYVVAGIAAIVWLWQFAPRR